MGHRIGVYFDPPGLWYNGFLKKDKNAEGSQAVGNWKEDDDQPVWIDATDFEVTWKPYHVAPNGDKLPERAPEMVGVCESDNAAARTAYYCDDKEKNIKWTIPKLKQEIGALQQHGWVVTPRTHLKADLIQSLIDAQPRKPRNAFRVTGKRSANSDAVEIEVAWEADGDAEWVLLRTVQNGEELLEEYEDKMDELPLNEEPEWVVERIVGQKVIGGIMMYQLKWLGFEEVTWQSRADLQETDEEGYLQNENAVLTNWEKHLAERNTGVCKQAWALHANDENSQICGACRSCRKRLREGPDAIECAEAQRVARYNKIPVEQGIKLSIGGDMSGLGDFFGTKKLGSCHYNSLISCTRTSYQQQGMPQGIPLPKTLCFAAQPVEAFDPPLRKLEQMHQQAEVQKAAEMRKEAVPVDSNGSMASSPLIKNGDLQDIVGLCPLHVDTGIATKVMDMYEAAVLEVSEQAELLKGKGNNGSSQMHMEMKSLEKEITGADVKVRWLERKETCEEEMCAEIKEANESAFCSQSKQYKTEAAEGFREVHSVHNKKLKEYRREMREVKASLKVMKENQDELSKKLAKVDGEIMRECRMVLNCMAFQRQSYYSGAINGNDVNRLFTEKCVPVRYHLKKDGCSHGHAKTKQGCPGCCDLKFTCPDCNKAFDSEEVYSG